MSIPFSSSPAEPDLSDALDSLKKEIFISFNCHHIGKIQSFASATQTAVATINYKKTYFTLDDTTNKYVPTLVNYPALIDCPVICLGGGDGSLTFPINTGDDCLVLFNDRDIDTWFQGNSSGPVASARLHSFSDGIILVGLRSLANVLTNYDTARVTLRGNKAGTTVVGVGESLVKIANVTTSLGTILTQLMTALTAFNTALGTAAVAFGATPVTEPSAAAGGADLATAATALQTSVTMIQTLIAGLLE